MKNRKKTEYIPLKGILGNAIDYNAYTMNYKERITGFAIGCAIGILVMYVFFRVWIVSAVVGIIVGILFQRPYQQHLLEKRKQGLLLQFKDMMEALSSSYAAGMNTPMAFEESYQDLKTIYGPQANIVQEIKIITMGLKNNIVIEDLLDDFAKRSGLDDVDSFASVFRVANRQGANIRHIVNETKEMLSEKIEIEMEIQTILSGNKNQLNIMLVMPIVIMLSLSSMGTMSAVANTPLNIIVKIIVMAIIAFAYVIGRKIVDIKV